MAAITRKQFRDAVQTILDAQVAATPTLLRKTERWRATGTPKEKPAAYQDEINSALTYDQGTRTHIMTQDVTIATTFPTDALGDEFDDLMDALLDRFTTNFNIIANTVLELLAIVPQDVTFTGADGVASITYRGAVLSLRLRIWEGRT